MLASPSFARSKAQPNLRPKITIEGENAQTFYELIGSKKRFRNVYCNYEKAEATDCAVDWVKIKDRNKTLKLGKFLIDHGGTIVRGRKGLVDGNCVGKGKVLRYVAQHPDFP